MHSDLHMSHVTYPTDVGYFEDQRPSTSYLFPLHVTKCKDEEKLEMLLQEYPNII